MKTAVEHKKYFSKHYYFPEDFNDTKELFIKILKIDKLFLESIPIEIKKVVMKNGLESRGVQYLIKSYVDDNKEAYFEHTKKKAKEDA